jgi:peptidoglycan/xylan/chitin deacetylase (PgdA/CDA1 family)
MFILIPAVLNYVSLNPNIILIEEKELFFDCPMSFNKENDRSYFVVHVDVDGASTIYRAHDWDYSYPDDPIFETGLSYILDLFERRGIKATFFVIAKNLEEPHKLELLKEVVRRGHEIASHSYTHPDMHKLDLDSKRREIVESREKLEHILGVKIRGFRAPGYQIDLECIELLDRYGYDFDSSAYANWAFSRRLNIPITNLRTIIQPYSENGLVELPVPFHQLLLFPLNISYSHVFGLQYFKLGVRLLQKRATPFVLLFHLVDLAEPLPRERLNGQKSRLFTLSNKSREQKLTHCQDIINFMFQNFCLTDTSTLLNDFIL